MMRRHSLATGGFDFRHDGVGDTGVLTTSIHAAAQVVDYYRRAPVRQLQGVQPAQAPAASGDDRDLLLEVDHGGIPSSTRPDNGGRVRNENLVMQDLAELPGHRGHRSQRTAPSQLCMRSNQIFVPFRKPRQDCSGRWRERVRTLLTPAAQRKRTPNVAMPKIFLPLDFAATITTPERVSRSNDLTLPVNSISQPSLADTIAGADRRTA